MKTSDRLAAALEAADAPPDMIERAREGYYDDFRSPLPTPATTLVAHARQFGLHDIARRVINGEFDASSAEADEWARSDEGQAVIRSMQGSR